MSSRKWGWGVQRSFGTFPKNYPFWYGYTSLRYLGLKHDIPGSKIVPCGKGVNLVSAGPLKGSPTQKKGGILWKSFIKWWPFLLPLWNPYSEICSLFWGVYFFTFFLFQNSLKAICTLIILQPSTLLLCTPMLSVQAQNITF